MEKYYEVISTDGNTYSVIASSIQVKDGNIYFCDFECGKIKKVFKENEVITIHPKERKYSTISKVGGAIAGAYATYWSKQMFVKHADAMCPSSNPVVKTYWRLTTSAAAFGIGCAVTKACTNAAQDTIQPFIDISKSIVTVLKKKPENANPEEIKEVYEENN